MAFLFFFSFLGWFDRGFAYSFVAWGWVIDRLVRDMDNMFERGERVELTGMIAEITELTADGRPKEVKYTFDVPLEDASLRWVQWKNGGYKPFTPPQISQTAKIYSIWE